jgi:hypothetical protein
MLLGRSELRRLESVRLPLRALLHLGRLVQLLVNKLLRCLALPLLGQLELSGFHIPTM